MNFNENVDKEFVDLVLESALWSKSKIDVVKRETLDEANTTPNEGDIGDIPEYETGIANEFEEPTDIDSEEELSFTLDDLQVVLDNLEDEDLMEHAMNMLEVFDVAYETLNEDDEDDEEAEEAEEDEEEEEEEEVAPPTAQERKKRTSKGRASRR